MNKLVKPIALALLSLFSLQMLSGCFGKFSLVRKVYDINKGIMGDDITGRLVRTLVMYVFYFIPVYGIAGLIDVVILNLIEFWTGKNPLSMLPGEKDTQFVTFHGKTYRMTAEPLKMSIVDMSTNKESVLYFEKGSNAVSMMNNGQMVKVAEFKIEERGFASLGKSMAAFN